MRPQDRDQSSCAISRSCTTWDQDASGQAFTSRNALSPKLAHLAGEGLSLVRVVLERFRGVGRPLCLSGSVCYSSFAMAGRRSSQRSYAAQRVFYRRLVLLGVWSLVIVLVVGLGAGAGVFAGFLRDLPSLDGLEEYQPSITT